LGFSDGASGAMTYCTEAEDGRPGYFVKSMTKEDAMSLESIATSYVGYMEANERSLLIKILLAVEITVNSQKLWFLVMENINPRFDRGLAEVFDLKV
jgi:hypothetical protein